MDEKSILWIKTTFHGWKHHFRGWKRHFFLSYGWKPHFMDETAKVMKNKKYQFRDPDKWEAYCHFLPIGVSNYDIINSWYHIWYYRAKIHDIVSLWYHQLVISKSSQTMISYQELMISYMISYGIRIQMLVMSILYPMSTYFHWYWHQISNIEAFDVHIK